MADGTEFVEMEHPDIKVTASIPAGDVARREGRGWKVVTEKSKTPTPAQYQDEAAVKDAAKGGNN